MNEAEDIAKWMLSEIEKTGELYQEEAVDMIEEKFGEPYVYENENGNSAIANSVLTAFRKLSGDNIVWSRSERYWRGREDHDEPGRQQH